MPFNRPTPAQLLGRIQADMDVDMVGSESRLRQSSEGIMARVFAMTSHEQHGHIEWCIKQMFVDTAEAEYLDWHGSDYGMTRKLAEEAKGDVLFTAAIGAVIPVGQVLKRGDEQLFTVDSEVTFSGTTAIVSVTASVAGQAGNTAIGTKLSLATPVPNVQTDGIVQDDGSGSGLSGGTEIETDDDWRSRIKERKQNTPEGGSENDYKRWMKEVAGVTRAWVYPKQLGLGTVQCIFVMDNKVGTNIPSAGEVETVQDYLDDPNRKPATAEVTVTAPSPVPLDFEIHIKPATAAIKAAIEEELKDLIHREAIPGGTLYKSRINEAISIALGEFDHVLVSPNANVTRTFGQLTTLGTITWDTL